MSLGSHCFACIFVYSTRDCYSFIICLTKYGKLSELLLKSSLFCVNFTLSSLLFCVNFRIKLSISTKEILLVFLERISIEFIDYSGGTGHLCDTAFLAIEHVVLHCLFRYSFTFFNNALKFSPSSSYNPFIGFIPRYHMFLLLLGMWSFVTVFSNYSLLVWGCCCFLCVVVKISLFSVIWNIINMWMVKCNPIRLRVAT